MFIMNDVIFVQELQRFYKEQDQLVLIKPHKTVAEKQREKILNNKIEEDIKQGNKNNSI